MEIIPAILENRWEDIQNKIKLVDGLTDWLQLDVSDGIFTPNKTWSDPGDLLSLRLKSKLEIHLMVSDPELYLADWLIDPVDRVVVQVESLSDVKHRVSNMGKEAVWGFKVETPWEPYKELMQDPHARVLFLSVEPGWQGQEFNSDVLNKIKTLKEAHPHVKIAVDGGINLENIKSIKHAGVDSAVIGSGIFTSANPKETLKQFQAIL